MLGQSRHQVGEDGPVGQEQRGHRDPGPTVALRRLCPSVRRALQTPCRRRYLAGAVPTAAARSDVVTGKIGAMTELAASLVELAGRYGVATGYDDWAGRHQASRGVDVGGGARRAGGTCGHRGRTRRSAARPRPRPLAALPAADRSSRGRGGRRRSGCTSPTAIRSACGSDSRTARFARACASWRTTGRRTTWMGG